MSDEQDKYYSFRNGLPTGPDVAMIQKHWPELKVGDRIPYEDMEQLLGVDRSTSRWTSVTVAWRKRARSAGLIIECEKSEAFYVATADQISAKTYSVITRVTHTARRQRYALSTTEQHKNLSDEVRLRCQHQGRLMWALEKDARASRKHVLPKTTASQIRIEPPVEDKKEINA